MRNSGLGVRIALLVAGVVLVAYSATIAFIVITIQSSTREAAYSEARGLAVTQAAVASTELVLVRSSVTELSNVLGMSGMFPKSSIRSIVEEMLRSTLANEPRIINTWAIFLPGTLDPQSYTRLGIHRMDGMISRKDFSGMPLPAILDEALKSGSVRISEPYKIEVVAKVYSLVMVIALIMVIITRMVGTLNATVSALKDISEGGGDLTKKIVSRRKDEIGMLAEHFNRFSSSLASTIGGIVASTEGLSKIGLELDATMADVSATVTEIAVVADEIRNLAESSSAESKGIGHSLKDIQSSIVSVVSSSERAEMTFADVRNRITALYSLQEELKRAMLEQKQGSSAALGSLVAIKDATAEVDTAAIEMREACAQVVTEMSSLVAASEEWKRGVGEIAGGAAEIDRSALAAAGLTRLNRDKIEDVAKVTRTFKTL